MDNKLEAALGVTRVVHRRYRQEADGQWERASGAACPNCEQETLQIVGGLCPRCRRGTSAKRDGQVEERTMRRYYQRQLREGTISLAQMREGNL